MPTINRKHRGSPGSIKSANDFLSDGGNTPLRENSLEKLLNKVSNELRIKDSQNNTLDQGNISPNQRERSY